MSSDFTQTRLSSELLQALQGLMTSRVFAKGSVLYLQGTSAAGIYLIEKGTVRVLLSAGENQNQLLEILGAGALLGLSESMSGVDYRSTVEAQEPTTAAFVPREVFLAFLDSHHEFCLQIVRLLSDDLHGLYHKFRSVSAHPGRPRRRALHQQMD